MAKVWCYTLDTDGLTGVFSIDGAAVASPKLHFIYKCEDDNLDLANDGTGKLYTAANGMIDASDLQDRIDAYTPAVVVSGFAYNPLSFILFDESDTLTDLGEDIAAGMSNADLKAKHGIKAKEANKLKKDYADHLND